MEKTKLLSADFFRDFQDKDSFFDKLTSDENLSSRLINLFLLLSICSFVYGLVMGSFGGFLQAVSSGVKVPALLILGMLICFPAFFIIQSSSKFHPHPALNPSTRLWDPLHLAVRDI